MRLFIFGAGYSGSAIAREALTAGHIVAGTTRSSVTMQNLSPGMRPFVFDGLELTEAVRAELAQATHLVTSIAPGESDPVLEAAGDVIAREMPALRWIGYLSTVGVYGDHRGEWVDEDSECRPVSQRSRRRLAAEQGWISLGQRIGRPVAVLRLSGIYGPNRNAFLGLRNGTARRIVKPGQVFNRIHVDDITGAAMLLAGSQTGGVFNVTDDEPAPPQDVISLAARIAGVSPPPEIQFDHAEMSPMARSFYAENKRVSNARLKSLGYVLRFPNYRSGLEAL